MKRTALYMRVSTTGQAVDGISLEAQREALLNYIKAHPDLVLVGEYMDDGISGTKFDQRDELQRLLRDVEQGKIDLVIFTKLDRFFRSVRHLMNTLDTLERCGVEWNAITEHHDSSTPTGKLSLTIMGAFAEMEASMDGERIRAVFEHKKSKKEWLNHRPPYGYVVADKHAVPDPERAEIARRVFRDFASHNNLSQLIRDYSSMGVPSSLRGMKYMLRNRAYIGEAHGIPDYLPAIIDRDTFEAVQRGLTMSVKASAKYTYIFTGLLVCPRCGRTLNAGTDKGCYPHYRCLNHALHQCDYKSVVSEQKTERYLLGNYKEELEKRYLHLKSVRRTDNTAKVNALYRKIDRLKELYVNELIDLNTYKEDLNRYREEINALETPTEVNTERIEQLLEMNVYEIYKTLSKENKRRLWRSVIKSIKYEDGAFFVEYL